MRFPDLGPDHPENSSYPTVIEEADELVHGDRNSDYGHPVVNFARIVGAWNAYMVGRPTVDEKPFTEHDVAMLMTMVKCCRGAEGYHRDTAVDIVGYGALDAVVSGDDEL